MSDKVLFVSGRCQHSKKILIGIHQYEFMKSLFRVVNIDTNPYPNYVKTVPCLVVNNQLISGETLFEYLGKLVEGKKEQDQQHQQQQQPQQGQAMQSKDQGQCRINEDGELEGWCASGGSVDFSMITEDNDDYTKKHYKMDTNLSFLDGADSGPIHEQVQQMEKSDSHLNQKNKQFDNDYERLQRERGEIGNGMPRK